MLLFNKSLNIFIKFENYIYIFKLFLSISYFDSLVLIPKVNYLNNIKNIIEKIINKLFKHFYNEEARHFFA